MAKQVVTVHSRILAKSPSRYRHAYARSVIPVITTPQSVVKRRAKRKKASSKSAIERQAVESPLVIACKRKELNHYRDNRYVEKANEEIPLKYLASGGWLHYKSKGDYFTINTHAKQNHLDKSVKFADLGLSESIGNVLRSEGVVHPSHIQVEAIPHILDLSNVICAAETGCGKTLAYLLPIIQKLVIYRSAMNPAGISSTCPRAVILLPSRELAEQVASVAEKFCVAQGLSVLNLSQGSATHRLIASLRAKVRDVDILVTTPGSLSIALNTEAISPALVNHIVIDEADTLLDSSFSKTTTHLLSRLSAKPSGILGTQVILASATMPRDLRTMLDGAVGVDSFINCTTEQLHRMLAHVTQKFIRLGHADKMGDLVKLMKESKEASTMIFANTCGTASFLNNLLAENQIPNIVLHAGVDSQNRVKLFEEFKRGDECKTLVCSDIASRGLDTTQVSQIINYNFPRYISDYIHRVGRVGRLGSLMSGKVINLIGHRPEINLVWQIERAVRGNRDIAELPNVNANIKKQVRSVMERRQLQQPTSLV